MWIFVNGLSRKSIFHLYLIKMFYKCKILFHFCISVLKYSTLTVFAITRIIENKYYTLNYLFTEYWFIQFDSLSLLPARCSKIITLLRRYGKMVFISGMSIIKRVIFDIKIPQIKSHLIGLGKKWWDMKYSEVETQSLS